MSRILKPWKLVLKLMLAATIIVPYSAVSFEEVVKAAGTSYYVDPSGSDSNNGTSLSTPFQTIQQAASVAVAGDTVNIRGGTYRETVTPANSGTSGNPITYQNYNNETVVISGNDLVTGWALDSGSIYKAPMSWSLGAGNQVFVDGVLMDEARWPNQTGTMLAPTRSTAGAGSDGTHVVDSTLPGGDNFWNGATIWITSGSAWIASTRSITAYDSVAKKLTFSNIGGGSVYYTPKSGNKYYLSGIKAALDTANEWWYDSANAQLYVWAPGGGDPSGNTVEAKRRTTAVDLSDKSYILINGIQTMAATIVTNSSSNHNSLDGIVAKYVSHNKLNTSAYEQSNLGIILDGSYNEIRNSEIAYSSGSLVTVKGSFNNVINSYIHDGGYVPNWEGLINLQGANSLISHNTVSDAGRVTVYFYAGMSANEIQYNNIYNAGRLTTDLGMLYGPNTDGQNTEIHHNYVHDNLAASTKSGIYLDNYTNNFIVHHNVLWNNEGIRLNTPSNYNLVYNNTVWTNTGVVGAWGDVFSADMYGDRIFNNIIKGLDSTTSSHVAYGNNLTSSPGFVNEASRDYHLLSTSSSAIDKGMVIPGITDGYAGSAPDIGAYEYGGADWSAGHNFANPPSPAYSRPSTPNMNLVVNGGFEYGDLSGWTPTDAGNAVVVNDNHWGKAANAGKSRSQMFGVKLSGAVDGVAQTITGLQPNTNYYAAGWLRTPAGETASLGVKDYGGSDVSASSSRSTWTLVGVKFKTGSANTSATIYLQKTSATGEAYADDAGLILDPTEYKSMYSFDGFESGLDNWTPGRGTPSLSSVQSHSGSYSYAINEDMDAIQQTFDTSYNKIVSMWFYDTATQTNMQVVGSVGDSVNTRSIGVNTPTSSTKYVYRLGGTHYATTITRTTGWHEFKWDYTSGTKLDMYIDGVLIASPTGATNFNAIAIGDYWPGNTTTAYFDDVRIYDNMNSPDVEQDKEALDIGYASGDSAVSVTQNVNLASSGAHGTTITWSSSNPSVIAADGTVTRPALNAGDANVTLTATISKGTASDTKTFTLTVLKQATFFDGFESGLGNWTSVPGKGTPSLSTAQAHSGSYSYVINEDLDAIQLTLASSYNKIVSMWFYDTATLTNMQVFGGVADSGNIRNIGVNTPTSTTKYVYRLGGTHYTTSIARTTGWHEFKWDYTSGTKVDMYIDGVLIASPTGATNFNTIAMGDYWAGNTTTVYFDDISIQ